MRLEIKTGPNNDWTAKPPTHQHPLHGWGDSETQGYPHVAELTDEEGERILKTLADYHEVQARLRQLTRRPYPNHCECGSCPDKTTG